MPIILNEEAREKIQIGVQKIADVVKLTLGPKGRNVIINRPNGEPLITNDGVTIAREVVLECPFENLGARAVRQASTKTNEEAGDGTTSAIVLAAEVMRQAAKHIALGQSPVLLKEGILRAAEFAAAEVARIAKPVDTAAAIRAIAVNSCANETDGTMVASALERAGASGVVTIEENRSGRTTLQFAEGFETKCELASPYFCENAERLETTYEDARILVTDQRISSIKDILPILEHASAEKFALVIIADDFSPEVISALIVNRVRAGLRVAALKCGCFADRRDAALGDIAALTGATVVSAESGIRLAEAMPKHLGACEKIIMNLQSTKIIGNADDDRANLDRRADLIKAQIDSAENEYDKARLSERLARLTSGIAIISVGCATEIEQKEKRLRIEDALAAARAAVAEGIVAGGGVAYLRVQKSLAKHISLLPKNLRCGAQIVHDALESILKQICLNASCSSDIVIGKIKANKKATAAFGYDALNSKYTDMFAANIVDPAKVVKNVIRNACSVAGTLLTSEAIIV